MERIFKDAAVKKPYWSFRSQKGFMLQSPSPHS